MDGRWTVEKRTVTGAGRDGHGEWSKTKDLLYDGKEMYVRITVNITLGRNVSL